MATHSGQIAEILLEAVIGAGGDALLENDRGETPFDLCVKHDSRAVASALLDRVDELLTALDAPSVFRECVENDSGGIASLLCERGITNGLGDVDSHGKSLLITAIDRRSLSVLRVIASRAEFDVNERLVHDSFGQFGIPEEERRSSVQTQHVRHTSMRGATPLVYAVATALSSGSTDARTAAVASTLLDHGARVDALNDVGETALALAARAVLVETASALLARGADPLLPDSRLRTPWQLVLQRANPSPAAFEMVRRFVLYEPRLLSQCGPELQTPLHVVARRGSVKVVRFMLFLRGEAVAVRDAAGSTPLAIARSTGRSDIVAQLRAFQDDPHAFRCRWSALIPLALAVASLDLPVLVACTIEEFLIELNDILCASFTPIIKWQIGKLIKERAQNILFFGT